MAISTDHLRLLDAHRAVRHFGGLDENWSNRRARCGAHCANPGINLDLPSRKGSMESALDTGPPPPRPATPAAGDVAEKCG